MIKIKIKKFRDSVPLPQFQTEGSVGADIVAMKIARRGLFRIWYDCEFAAEIPKPFACFIFPSSSIRKYPLVLANSVGVVDTDYRGTFQVCFNRTFLGIFTRRAYKVGQRIAQLLIMKVEPVEYIDSKIISETGRGKGGFGHTGK